MKAALIYSAERLGLLLMAGFVSYVLGMRGLLLFVVAFVVSGVLSVFLLRGPRSQFSDSATGYFKSVNARIDAASRKEDDDSEPQPAPAAHGPAVIPGEVIDLTPGDQGAGTTGTVTSPSTSAGPRTAGSPRSS